MFDDEELPKKKDNPLQPRLLEGLDVDDMQDYIAFLKAEIVRTEAEMAKRGDVKAAADAFFKN